MPLYEVVTEDLDAVQQQLGRQGEGLDQTQAETTQSVTTLITETDTAATQGETQITQSLGDLAQVVATSDQVAQAANWTGADSDRMRQSNADLTQVIDQTNQRMTAAIADFKSRTAQIDADLQALTDEFTTAITQQRELTTQLQSAVQIEMQSYEEAFNGSFAYGG
jgi:predicted  nucleic acid-binding Zn-ribbon protein